MEYTHDKDSPRLVKLLIAQSPFIAVLASAFFGVAYTSVSRREMSAYWMVLVPLFGIVCVSLAWRRAAHAGRQAALLQALHWIAVMLAMYLALTADMSSAMGAEASALVLLVILALGAATSGLHLRAWPVVIVGGVLAMGVPIFAWVEERTLLFALGGVGAVAVVAMVVAMRGRSSAAQG